MKIAALLASLLAMATAMVGHTNSDIIKCRDYLSKVDKGLTTLENIEFDLLNGKWSLNETSDNETVFLFDENGTAHQFDKDLAGHTSYQALFWDVAFLKGQPILKLTEMDHHEKWMNIEQTCSGLTLTNLYGKEILNLDFQPFTAPKKMDKVTASLMGDWANVTELEPSDEAAKTQGVFLNYYFESNGHFVHEYGNSESSVTEKGQWELSRDGQFLLLHVFECSEPNLAQGVKVVKVNHLDGHALVLEEVMKESQLSQFFDSKNKVFTFIK